MTENIIELQNVSKEFQLNSTSEGFGYFRNFNLGKPKKKIKALDNISFSVEKGEVFGIIGLNGSGKTTLLQVIAGLYNPDLGSVKVYGTLAPILQIGVGFNMELLPSENIIIYGMMLGFPKSEIKNKINSILEFAELGKFSSMKIKHFSSGMKSRLAISTIFQLNPDIFLLDEVLAVGDINFKKKCFDAFSSFKKNGKTILYVTHSLNTVTEFCDRALILHTGKILMIGKPNEVVSKYKELSKEYSNT